MEMLRKVIVMILTIMLALPFVGCDKDKDNIKIPSEVGEFDVTTYDDEYFEENTLVLVPVSWGQWIYEGLKFYTVYKRNGIINFVVEINLPEDGAPDAIDDRVYAVTIANDELIGSEIGEMEIFEANRYENGVITLNSREWIEEIADYAIKHQVDFVSMGVLKEYIFNESIVINSKAALEELLR